jgi:hypothetical protein
VDLDVGTQVLFNNRPAVIIGMTPFAPCAIITVFRPARLAPPMDLGIARVGDWGTKCITLVQTLDGKCFTEVDQRVRVQPNPDPATFVALDAWLEAFAARCRA